MRPRAVARDLVMLDRLRGSEQCGVQHFLVGDIGGELVRFLDDCRRSRGNPRPWVCAHAA